MALPQTLITDRALLRRHSVAISAVSNTIERVENRMDQSVTSTAASSTVRLSEEVPATKRKRKVGKASVKYEQMDSAAESVGLVHCKSFPECGGKEGRGSQRLSCHPELVDECLSGRTLPRNCCEGRRGDA